MAVFDDEEYSLPTLRDEVEAFFRKALGPLSRRGVPVGLWNPQLDVTEDEGRFILEMDLPGVRREDITIEVHDRTLVIAGSRKIVRREMSDRYSHCERVSGSFRRSIPLPLKVDEEKIAAVLEEGILRVEIPKKGASR